MAIRVLHMVYYLERGGIENWLLDFCRVADPTELQMEICCRGVMGGALEPEFRSAGVPVHHVPMTWSHASFGHRLGRLLREGRFDLLHVHAGSFAGYPCSVALRNGVGSVTTFHNTSFPFEVTGLASSLNWLRAAYTRLSFRAVCRRGSAVISCSKAAERAVVDLSGIEPDDRYYVVPCGTGKSPGSDPQVRAEVRRELGIGPDVPLAIHVGAFKDQKNHPGLLRVADRIRRTLPEFRLLLAGDGLLRPDVERRVRELDLGTTVRMLGSRGDVERLLEAADLMLFPSLWEGLPVAVIEAQIKGLPVVGSDIGPLQEATRNGVTAMLFPVADEQAMARAAVELLTDAPRRRSMGQAATRFAAETFSIGANASRHLEIYHQALARVRGEPTGTAAAATVRPEQVTAR